MRLVWRSRLRMGYKTLNAAKAETDEGAHMRRSEFMQFVLDDDALHTPEGLIDPQTIRVARIDRVRVGGHHEEEASLSPQAIAGGALSGGIIAGPAGAVAGALMGSYIKELEPEEEMPRTISATLRIETDTRDWNVEIPLGQIGAAEDFAAEVRRASGVQ